MKKTLILLAVLVFGFGGIFVLSNSLRKNQPNTDEKFADEDLFFSPTQLNAVGHDFRGLIADWYWINSLQYTGNKLVNFQGEININDLRPLNLRLIYPMLDTATTLDPQFMTVYSYGASVLPAVDTQLAIKLLEKGIAANPEKWRLYHNLGYIYWQMKDFQKASEYYAQGSQKQGAPIWMKQMSVSMQAQGGSREFAMQVYQEMYETAEDEQTKSFAELRYAQIQSLNERDAIRSILQAFQKQKGRCINSWREISSELRNIKLADNTTLNFNNDAAPIDPTKVPYLILNQDDKCDVILDWKVSKIPQQ